jgi:hypothetical protein
MSSSLVAVLLPHRPAMSAEHIGFTEAEQHGLLAALAGVPDPRD